MDKKSRYQFIWIGSLLLGILELVVVLDSVLDDGIRMLQYYTELSNLISGIVLLISSYHTYRYLKEDIEIPEWIRIARFTTVCLTSITFLIALFVLGPTYGYVWILFHGQMIFTHTICPILSFLLFVIFEKEPPLNEKAVIYSLLPTILYGLITIPLNILRVMHGPYPFLYVYEQSWYTSILWVIGILVFAFFLAKGIFYLNRKDYS